MAARDMVALRLDVETREQVEWLAERLGVPKTVLMRRMIENGTRAAWSLAHGEDSDGK